MARSRLIAFGVLAVGFSITAGLLSYGPIGDFVEFRKYRNEKLSLDYRPPADAPRDSVTPSYDVQEPVHPPYEGEVGPFRPENVIFSYWAGTVPSGTYAGYKRLVLVADPENHYPIVRLVVTNDNTTYVMDNDPEYPAGYSMSTTDYNSPFFGTEPGKMRGVDEIESNHPRVIPLDKGFALYRDEIFVPNKRTEEGREAYFPPGDFIGYRELASPIPTLRLYTNPQPSLYATEEGTDRYFVGDDTIIALDRGGLAYYYHLARARHAVQQEGLTGLGIVSSDVDTAAGIFNRYGGFITTTCGRRSAQEIINVASAELSRIGSLDGVDLYVIGDKSHPLYRVAFNDKSPADLSLEDYHRVWGAIGAKPIFSEYIAREPLLLFRDPWDRLFALQEADFPFYPGGCGKPVLYLYPPRPTEVSVRFVLPMQFAVDIPAYRDGWSVRAHPDGTLEDLQPEVTDCLAMDSERRGSEYAKAACEQRVYPYLYWAGQNPTRAMPRVEGGWVVAQKDLEGFLQAKLDEIGLTGREKADMIGYWLPEMLGKNALWYRVAFLQTREMNRFIPMVIEPKPDSFSRIFLVWEPLASEPKVKLEPQVLVPIRRNGFTVIEWGGLHR